jgi:hypothetical protein
VSNNSSVEIVEGSKILFSSADLPKITKCVIRECTSKEYNKTYLKLYIEALLGKKKVWKFWAKLDSYSYKYYKDYINKGVDPSRVCLYKLHDKNEILGNAKNNYSWDVCIIRKDSLDDSYGDSFVDEDDFFDNVPF